MDSLITTSARALAAGNALGALKLVAPRDDPAALALRGIAMAQLGQHPRVRESYRPTSALNANVRCLVRSSTACSAGNNRSLMRRRFG